MCILYSLGIDVYGQLIEAFSGMALGAYLQKYVFYPLCMHDTGFFVPEHHLLRLRRSCIIKSAIGCCTRWIKREKIAYGVRRPFESGGGGLVSSMCDYYRFATMQLD